MIVVGAFLGMVIVSGLRGRQNGNAVWCSLGQFRRQRQVCFTYIPVLESVFFLDTRVLVLNIPNKKSSPKIMCRAEMMRLVFHD